MEVRNNFASIRQIQLQYLNNNQKSNDKRADNETATFEDLFKEKLKFSKHADERLATRNINLTSEQMDRLNAGMKKASEKGINESLMLMDNLAFIVNVKNNTVITAMDSSGTDERVFTNIDGAVIV
ncbi:MAG: TIGR02530 family flagellar biosynthesis protein [Lachnospiraceae bacterium]